MEEPSTARSVLHKHPKTRNFTQVENSMVRDPSLSFRATGVLVFLLSMPDGSSVNSRELAKRKPEGRDAIRAAERELEAGGYLKRERIQQANGRWVTVTHVFEEPPRPDFQAPDNRAPVDQALSSTKRKRYVKEGLGIDCACGQHFTDVVAYQDHYETCDETWNQRALS